MSDKPWRIEPARADDIPSLVALLADLFSIEQDFNPDAERQVRGLSAVLSSPTGCIMVARAAQSQVIAMCSAQLVFSTAEGAPSAWVEDMVVHAEWRGQGVGREVLQAALDWARAQGATRAQLLADVDNHHALAYYQHLGWSETRLIARRLSLALNTTGVS